MTHFDQIVLADTLGGGQPRGRRTSESSCRRLRPTPARLARMDGARVTILHAWQVFGESLLRQIARVPDSELQELLSETRETRGRQV